MPINKKRPVFIPALVEGLLVLDDQSFTTVNVLVVPAMFTFT